MYIYPKITSFHKHFFLAPDPNYRVLVTQAERADLPARPAATARADLVLKAGHLAAQGHLQRSATDAESPYGRLLLKGMLLIRALENKKQNTLRCVFVISIF
jgi:hypothetical protein